MKVIIFLLFGLLPLFSLAVYRPIHIKKEIETARFVGEIIFVGYDSTKVSLFSDHFYAVSVDSITGEASRAESADSIWIITRIHYVKADEFDDSIYSANLIFTLNHQIYNVRPEILPTPFISNGFWPALNERCLAIINSNNCISCFAIMEEENYVFWDPYFNTAYNTIFVFDEPFEFYPLKRKETYPKSIFANAASFFKTKYACQFHCTLDKKLITEMRQFSSSGLNTE